MTFHLAASISPMISKFVILSLFLIVVGFIFQLFKQPQLISYIIVGVLVGPHGFQIITEEVLINNLGDLGLVLLLFFIGMEFPIDSMAKLWKKALVAVLIQISLSVLIILAIGPLFGWKINQMIVFSFVLTLSSTAVILKILESKKELDSKIGQSVISILLAQDIIIMPMLIISNYLGGQSPDRSEVILQIIGAVILMVILAILFTRKKIHLPFEKYIIRDHETQVFVAFTLCFGFAILAGFFHFSSALGAFVAGMIVSSARSTHWVHDSLHAFRTMFVAIFFVSVGMILKVDFLLDNIITIISLCLIVLIVNNIINTFIFRSFRNSWADSIYAGSLLAQIGEFSFILGASAYTLNIVGDYAYQIIVSTISLSLLLSPIWISIVQYFFHSGRKIKKS